MPDAALLEHLRKLKGRLDVTILNGRSLKWCLTRWGRFIKARDGNRCVMCGWTEGLEAHHIWRKTTYSEGRFELGNGITLCQECQRGEISRLRMAVWIWRDMPEVVYQNFFGSLLGSNSA